MNLLLLKKEVNWSFFRQGFSIPIGKQDLIFDKVAPVTRPGKKQKVNLIIDDKSFSVGIYNLNFSRKKYPDHSKILQIRYDSNNDLKQYLKQKFNTSYNFIIEKRNEIDIQGEKYVVIPKKLKEFFVLYTTDLPYSLIMDWVTTHELMNLNIYIEKEEIKEEEIENILNRKDVSANITLTQKLTKIRKLNQRIGEDLKEIYNNRCQLCGYSSYDSYSCYISEAHHIKPFVESLNNDSNNLMILCPNHHRIIHKVSPRFIRSKLIYKYPNGLEEKLKLNYHL